jgi:hypothetical protein
MHYAVYIQLPCFGKHVKLLIPAAFDVKQAAGRKNNCRILTLLSGIRVGERKKQYTQKFVPWPRELHGKPVGLPVEVLGGVALRVGGRRL